MTTTSTPVSDGRQDQGVPASPSGHSDEPASGLAAVAGSVPNAGALRHLLAEFQEWPDSELVQLCLAPTPGEHDGEPVVAATLGQLRRFATAAPELLAALERLLRGVETLAGLPYTCLVEQRAVAHEAIAKARGQS